MFPPFLPERGKSPFSWLTFSRNIKSASSLRLRVWSPFLSAQVVSTQVSPTFLPSLCLADTHTNLWTISSKNTNRSNLVQGFVRRELQLPCRLLSAQCTSKLTVRQCTGVYASFCLHRFFIGANSTHRRRPCVPALWACLLIQRF